MALIKCPECGKEVSSIAKSCPNCGYPISETQHTTEPEPDILTLECPFCGVTVEKDDEYCDECGMRIQSYNKTPRVEKIDPHKKRCINCRQELLKSQVICPVCGIEVPDENNLKDDMMYCPECGELNKIGSFSCIHCGRKYKASEMNVCILKTNSTEIIFNEHIENIARCPKCGSSSLQSQKKGFGIGKAVVGAAVAGPIGLIAGNINAKKVWVTCLKCGRRFKI